MHRTTYARYEQGAVTVPLEFAEELAKYYKVSMDYITGLTNDKGGLHKNSKQEMELINTFNTLSDIRKGRVLQMIDMLLEEQEKESIK